MQKRVLCFASDYGPLPVSNMFDVDGMETDDFELVSTVVCEMPNGQWVASQCRDGDLALVPVH